MATTEASLPITSLLYGFENSNLLALTAKNDLTLERDDYTEFSKFLSCYDTIFWYFSLVYRGIFPNTYGMFC